MEDEEAEAEVEAEEKKRGGMNVLNLRGKVGWNMLGIE